jgi:uncharacterized protein (DUF305 family)
MRPRAVTIGLALVLVLGVVSALSLHRRTPASAQMGPMSPAILEQQSGEMFDRVWLQQMIMHHAMGVMMTQPVVDGAPHEDLRDLGGVIVADQTREIAQMRAWLREWYGVTMPDPVTMMAAMHEGRLSAGGMGMGMFHSHIGPMAGPHMGPTGFGPMMHMGAATMPRDSWQGMGMGMYGMGMMADLATLPGPRLEAVFMAMMIPHHEGAIEMANLALDRAAHDELKALARAIIASQSAEIEQMNRWLAEWYGM